VHQRAVPGKRVGLAAVGEAQCGGVEDPDQDVIDVIVASVDAAERIGFGRLSDPAAAGAGNG